MPVIGCVKLGPADKGWEQKFHYTRV